MSFVVKLNQEWAVEQMCIMISFVVLNLCASIWIWVFRLDCSVGKGAIFIIIHENIKTIIRNNIISLQ